VVDLLARLVDSLSRGTATSGRQNCSTTNSVPRTRRRGASTHRRNHTRASRTNSDWRRSSNLRTGRCRHG